MKTCTETAELGLWNTS